ncbi:MAG: protein kinase domain-containing protein [Roseiflexaceae bacterium]
MRCPTCQHDNPDGAPFCAECGTRLNAATPSITAGPTGTLPRQTVLQDRYVITQKLGQGGMGAVYHAGDRRLSTVSWAIKEMSEAAITGPLERQQARETFLHEAEMLAGLSHPNLPRVTDYFEQDGKDYLVMEFVPGETLLSYLQREGLPQPPARVFEWVRQLCDVLEYLHTQQPPIIFRDLKPANIMLTPQGQIKLIDFGIARLFKPGQAKDTQAFGTVGYSAPEQYGRGQTDARSDVYALGVLVHQLLTGYDPTATPFRLPPADQANPAISPQVAAVLAAATDSDLARRHPTVGAFRDALFGAASQAPRPVAQPFEPAPQGGAVYPRPASQPVEWPGSQPFGLPGVPPFGVPGAPARTTGLANASRWAGIASVAVMAIATLMVLGAAIGGNASSALGGFGLLVGFPPIAGGPVALVLGIMALTRPQTAQTADGRRHAIVGVATGVVTLLLCCVIFAMVGAAGSRSR